MLDFIKSNFRFSPTITAVCVSLACVMVWASTWQWERYLKKVELVKTYGEHSKSLPLELPLDTGEFESVFDRKVKIRGTFDYEKQVIVTNRKEVSGPGHLLLTPLKLEDSDKRIIVSRGFIPFEDREPKDWEKYNFEENVEIYGVVKPSVDSMLFAPSNPDANLQKPFARIWYFPEIGKMAQQLPYPVVSEIYLQKIGAPPKGEFPSEYIRIEVPPQTHFGYTIEWAVLAVVTLLLGFIMQVMPKRRATRVVFESDASSDSPTIH